MGTSLFVGGIVRYDSRYLLVFNVCFMGRRLRFVQ